MRPTTLTLALAAVAVLTSNAGAVPVVVPPGLVTGDQYRLAFVTSTTRNAVSHVAQDYNDHATAAAESVPELDALTASWRAIVSVDPSPNPENTSSALFNTGTNPATDGAGVPIYNTAGQLIATGNADLWDGTLAAPIRFDENGGDLGMRTVWTGSFSNGQPYTQRGLGEVQAAFGQSWETSAGFWIAGGTTGRLADLPFYALSSILTAQVPEPSTAALAVAALCLAIGRRPL